MKGAGQIGSYACTPLCVTGMSCDAASADSACTDETAPEACDSEYQCTAESFYCAAQGPEKYVAISSPAPSVFRTELQEAGAVALDEEAAILLIETLPRNLTADNASNYRLLIQWFVDKKLSAGDRSFHEMSPEQRVEAAMNGIRELSAIVGGSGRLKFISGEGKLTVAGRRHLTECWGEVMRRLVKIDTVELALLHHASGNTNVSMGPLRKAIKIAIESDKLIDPRKFLPPETVDRVAKAVAPRFHAAVHTSRDIKVFYLNGRFMAKGSELIREIVFKRNPSLAADGARAKAQMIKAKVSQSLTPYTARPGEALDMEYREGDSRADAEEKSIDPPRMWPQDDATREESRSKQADKAQGFAKSKTDARMLLIDKIIAQVSPADTKFTEAAEAQQRERAEAILQWMDARDILRYCVDSEGDLTDLGKRAIQRIALNTDLLQDIPAEANEGKLSDTKLPFPQEQLVEAVLDTIHAYDKFGLNRFEREQLRQYADHIASSISLRIAAELRGCGEISRYYDSITGIFTERTSRLARADILIQVSAGGNIFASITGKVTFD